MEIEITDFIAKIYSLLDDQEEMPLTETTIYKNLEEWNSLTSLSLIAMIEDNYGVLLKSREIRDLNTIEELFYYIKMKHNKTV